VVDIDGVVASLVPDNDYARSSPLQANIDRVNALFDQGHRIVMFPARGSETGKDWSQVTMNGATPRATRCRPAMRVRFKTRCSRRFMGRWVR
jgi:hypothetical protein